MEEEIAEPESPLDEKEKESDKQKEEEWIHPCLPPDESNSLTPTLYECYDPMDAIMNDAYGHELAIVPHVKHEIVAIAPTLDCHIILLKSPTILENFALIKA